MAAPGAQRRTTPEDDVQANREPAPMLTLAALTRTFAPAPAPTRE